MLTLRNGWGLVRTETAWCLVSPHGHRFETASPDTAKMCLSAKIAAYTRWLKRIKPTDRVLPVPAGKRKAFHPPSYRWYPKPTRRTQ